MSHPLAIALLNGFVVKRIKPTKLAVATETVRELRSDRLDRIHGGYVDPRTSYRISCQCPAGDN